ncbi:MAG: CBS domain-containing protein [Bacteroidota bacterium]
MTIQNLINGTTPPLRPTDSVEHALGLFMELRVRHLPVVDDQGTLVGLISEDYLLDHADGPDARIASLLGQAPVSVLPHQHVFDVTKVMVQHDLTTVPVATADGQYDGLVKRHDIFVQFARMLSTQERGAILALEVAPRDYSLSQLVYDIEQSGVKILSIASETPDHPDDATRVTVKLNVQDTTRIRHVLEHHGYRVVASFSEEDDDEAVRLRVQEFMRYLEV